MRMSPSSITTPTTRQRRRPYFVSPLPWLSYLLLHLVASNVAASSSLSSPSTPSPLESSGFAPDDYSETCSIYLAPSSIPGAGLGMYAAKNYSKDDFITSGDILIPLVDLQAHNADIDIHELVLQSYYWLTYQMPAHMQTESAHTLAFSPGAGAALNCFFPLVNTQAWEEETQWSNAGLHRRRDAGVGAFTPYYNRTTYATRDILAGEELFTDYGPAYFTTQEDVFGKIPLEDTLPESDALLQQYVKTRDKIIRMAATSSNSKNDASESNSNSQLHEDWYHLITSLSQRWPSRILNGLPYTADTVDTLSQTSVSWRDYQRSIKSIDWLDTHGRCMDNIYPAQSLLPQAGRGAFAKRHIAAGSVVAPAPLVHLDRQVLYMYPGATRIDEDEDDDDVNIHEHYTSFQADLTAPVHHYQLLLNYCFGRDDSSLLLCPYGMLTGLINHGSGATANARIVWNDDFSAHTEWKDLPLHQWIYDDATGLAFDFVATRDIEPGEEVYIDYGDEWQAAWDAHVQNWKPPRRADKYRSAIELNDDKDLMVRTIHEELYPDVIISCHQWFRHVQGHRVVDDDDDDEDAAATQTDYCRATSRRQTKDGETLYTAELYKHVVGVNECHDFVIGVLFDLPRVSFWFNDLPYSRDTHQPWTFRHAMGIPDELTSESWRNMKVK